MAISNCHSNCHQIHTQIPIWIPTQISTYSFSFFDYDCTNVIDLRNLHEQVSSWWGSKSIHWNNQNVKFNKQLRGRNLQKQVKKMTNSHKKYFKSWFSSQSNAFPASLIFFEDVNFDRQLLVSSFEISRKN